MISERAFRRSRSLSTLAVLAAASGPRARRAGGCAQQSQRRSRAGGRPAATRRPAGQPRLAVVSLGDQRVTIYDADGAVMQGPISTGATPNDTPPGIYAILQKNREHYSNRYDDAAMPFMQRITWTGIALHAGALPGYPASHGCVRLREDFASKLFDMTKLGMRVVISRNNMAPAPIAHPVLFKPRPFRDNVAVLTPAAVQMPAPTEEGKNTRYDGGGQNDPPELATRTSALQALSAAKTAEAEQLAKKVEDARVAFKQKQRDSARAAKALKSAERAYMNAVEWQADAEKDLTRAKTEKQTKRAEDQKTKAIAKVAETKAKFDAVTAENRPALDELARAEAAFKAADAEHKAAAGAAREAVRKLSPVSVFVSLKAKKIYIRQDMEQIYEGDVAIRDPDQPIGTHIFTAVDYQPGGRDMKWNVVSIAGRQPGEPEKSSGMNRSGRNGFRAGDPDGRCRSYGRARPGRNPQGDGRAHLRAGPAGVVADRFRRGGAQGDRQGDRLHRPAFRRAAGRHHPASEAAAGVL